ncbi:MAG: phosphoribosylanthranilate isomerase [Acholeplasmatales bacterium]|nr:phosphoribosylanthranilate isomerase [Acholeplasmatales bacterium]
MLVKICGLRRNEDIEYANILKPDFIGFVFALNKVRTITPSKAEELKDKLDSNIKVVGVFRNNDISLIEEVVKLGIIDYIQLHGDESDEYILEIKKFTNLPIINAYRDSKYCDYVLYDNIDPGKGMKFDWNIINGDKKFFIAGGINIDDIDNIKKLNPYCVDVSSSVETNGYKDYNKMKEFIERVRK